MSTERLFSFANPWFAASVGGIVAIAAVSAVVGFIWFPSLEPGAGTLWDAICRAAGLVRPTAQPAPVAPPPNASTVVFVPGMFDHPSNVSIGRGATLAHQCAICHDARRPDQADTPSLAGQFAPAIYKELEDFKSGARVSAVMTPQAVNLSEQDILDLAAYFAYLPRLVPANPPSAPRIVESGAPMRNIPPCAACHGGLDTKEGSPWLQGLSANYLRAELKSFAAGTRHNDIGQQMRNVARGLTPAEIDAAAGYFSVAPPG